MIPSSTRDKTGKNLIKHNNADQNTKECLQTRPMVGVKNNVQYLPKKLKEKNESEKFPNESHYASGESLEKAFEIGEKCLVMGVTPFPLSRKNSNPTVSITITSPEGKSKSLLANESRRKSGFKLGISSDSEFWLPKVTSPSSKTEKPYELSGDNEDKKDEEKINLESDNTTIISDDIIKGENTEMKADVVRDAEKLESGNTIADTVEMQFKKALEQKGLKFTEKTKELIHVCHTLDETWIAVNKQSIIVFRQKTESINFISIQKVTCLIVDSNYQILCFVLLPEYDTERNDPIEVVPGEVTKTESLITSVLFASSRYYQSQTQLASDYALRLISKPLLELPSNQLMLKAIGMDYAKNLAYSAVVYFESVEPETNITDELMMQIGSEIYKPVNLNIKGSILKIKPSCGTCESEENTLNINTYSMTVSRTETPRPHTVNILLESKSVNLSASNASIADELLARLRFVTDTSATIAKQPAYLILTEYFLFLFSVLKSKKLLIQTPTLNLISLGHSDEISILIANDSKEADESVSNIGSTSWWRITFLKQSQCIEFNDILSSSIEFALGGY